MVTGCAPNPCSRRARQTRTIRARTQATRGNATHHREVGGRVAHWGACRELGGALRAGRDQRDLIGWLALGDEGCVVANPSHGQRASAGAQGVARGAVQHAPVDCAHADRPQVKGSPEAKEQSGQQEKLTHEAVAGLQREAQQLPLLAEQLH